MTASGTGNTITDDNYFGSVANTITLGGSSNPLTVDSAAKSGSATISGTSDTVTVAGASSESITFDLDAHGTLLLQNAQSFTGNGGGPCRWRRHRPCELPVFQWRKHQQCHRHRGVAFSGTGTILISLIHHPFKLP
jgi:hypothetical protein